MHKDVLFRGCTRPAMFLGVPYIPFFIGAGGGLLLGMYIDLWYLLLRFPHISSCEIKRLVGQAVEEGARMGHASR
ncbi:hypothetical protein B7L66_07585 [Xanthomonas citri pv. citri]|nr:hypothetical protein B7L66_07585 [Xanthomonas citri pv. citri]